MDNTQRTKIETLIDKAANAGSAPEAVNFAQAACNAANALRVLAELGRDDNSPQE